MKKKDPSIHNICVASILRSTHEDANPKWTTIHKSVDFLNEDLQNLELEFEPNEIPICSTIIDTNNWSVLTTQRLITKKDNQIIEGNMTLAKNELYGDFKGYRDKEYTLGKISFPDNTEMDYFIETGSLSMIMVNGVGTRIQIEPNTEDENQLMIKRWTKRGIIKNN